MIIEYETTPEDIILFNIYMAHRSLKNRRLFTKNALKFLSVAAASFIAFYLSRENVFLSDFFLLVSLFTLTVSISYFFLRDRIVRMQATKLIRQGNYYKDAIGRYKLDLQPEVLSATSSIANGKRLWSSIEDIDVTEKYIYIFTSEMNAVIVPKRAFVDEKQCAEFSQLAKQYHDVARTTASKATVM